MKYSYLIIVLLFNLFSIKGQISEGGLPPSFNRINSRSASFDNIPEYRAVVDFDVERLNWEDEMVDKEGDGNRRFAVTIPVENLNIENAGVWVTLDDSTTVWQQSIKSEGAKGMIISYNNFFIPEGAKLFLYNKDKTQILGAYTNKTNPRGGLFSTDMILGDEVFFEYVPSKISDDKPQIDIEDVGYVYSDVLLRSNPGFGQSESCMINVNCPEGDDWQLQKNGVVLIWIKKLSLAWEYCTGSLLNNTAQDKKPYVLTASHCFVPNSTTPEQSQFHFNYEFPGCENLEKEPSYNCLVGAKILVRNDLSGSGDGTLLYLTTGIPEEWNPFFNGWDIRNSPASSGVVIHHPFNDVKKITTYRRSLTTAPSDTKISNQQAAPNSLWKVIYNGKSVTQGGSSGSPLFNEYGVIVGTLSGGSSSCSNLGGADYYGKLWYNWNKDTSNDGKEHDMSKYLDPNRTAVLALDGYGIIDGVEYRVSTTDIPTGIEDENKWESELKDFVLYPNPAQDQLNINTSSIMKKITIYNLNGRIVYQTNNYNSSTISISLNDLSKGIYTISVETDTSKTYTNKFIKN